MSTVISKDGTEIAYETSGKGPSLILVDGALCSRDFGPMPTLAPLLAKHFTVFVYDRRGRGGSGDTQPYATKREVEDLGALIEAAGGSAFVAGLSSGAVLALEAAASGLAITKVAAYEPPFMVGEDVARHAAAGHEAQLRRIVDDGRRGDAVRYFMRQMVGMPAPAVFVMRLMFRMWPKLEAVAHTLPYDAALLGDTSVPAARLATIRTPTLAMHGGKTAPQLQRAAKAVADAVPNAQLRVLAGQTHNVKPEILTPALVEFFTA